LNAIDLNARPSLPRALALALPLALCLLCLLFSAGAKASGATVVGWGDNVLGQLGTGTTSATVPCGCIKVPEPALGVSGATQVVAGGFHTLALLADGTVMAWGFNASGELGDGTGGQDCGGGCRATPEPVPGLSGVVAIAAGADHSLALLADGTVMTWGVNGNGELGNGTTTGPDCGGLCNATPARVPGLTNVVAIAAGGLHSLALLADGTVMSWGFDEFGEVGDGTSPEHNCRCVDVPTPVRGVSGAMAISAGQFGGLALLGDGTVKAWGVDRHGELGNGVLTPQVGCECLAPVSVSGLSGVQALAAGDSHSLAMMPSGAVQSWGSGSHGQLGQNLLNICKCSLTPAPVIGLSSTQAIAAGFDHSLALLSNGSAKAWGANKEGELGDETTNDREIPTAVRGIGGAGVLAGASAVAAIGSNRSTTPNSFALIGPSQTLKITLTGAGQGAIGGPGILCPSGCEAHYPQGQIENLRVEPRPGSAFAGFSSGPCTGTATLCRVRLDQDQSLTATFGPPKGTAIDQAKVNSAKKSAVFTFSAPGAITGFECELIRPRPHRRKRKAHRPPARPKPRFSGCTSTKTFKRLAPGRYTFKVRALDILGADANPAARSFTIKARHRAFNGGAPGPSAKNPG
jgi:alpha-tubulin suppressor-like RCC1 family protein